MSGRYATLLAGHDGSARGAELRWSVVEYVCHVGDNLRIWAERLAGAALGGSAVIASYDNDLLAQARAYGGVAVQGALWSLGHAVAEWVEAVPLAARAGVVLSHPERGELALLAVMRGNVHDAHHHAWDIERLLASG
jgi:hypothetical protein